MAEPIAPGDSETGRVEAFSDGIALAYNAVWWYAARGGRLLDRKADREAVETISKRYLIGPAAYGGSFALAFANPWASLAVHGLLIAFYVLPVRKPTSRRPAI